MVLLLGKGEGIISPLMGFEKFAEITKKVLGESGRKFFPWVKEKFKITVEDVINAVKLIIVAATLLDGPEYSAEIVEATPERAVIRVTKCPWLERYKEFEVDLSLGNCHIAHQAWGEEDLKAVNPKLTYKLTKALPRGDPYCEDVYEFKGE